MNNSPLKPARKKEKINHIKLGVAVSKAKKTKSTRWHTKEFMFLSDAQSFQRKKRKEGYKTKLEKHGGIASPYSSVKWTKAGARKTKSSTKKATKKRTS